MIFNFFNICNLIYNTIPFYNCNILVSNNRYKDRWYRYTNEIKFAGAVRALSGIRSIYDTKSKYSDCFIVNDRAHSKVRVYGTRSLINQLENTTNGSLLMHDSSLLPTIGALDNTYIKDKNGSLSSQYSMAGVRITKLISQLHTYKLSLSLDLNKIKES